MRAHSTYRRLSPAGRITAAALTLVVLWPLPALADADGPVGAAESDGVSHDEIRPLTPQERATRLRDKGEILPLAKVIQMNGLDRIGRIIEVELEEENGRQIYELKVLTNDSVVREYYIDPVTGRILEIE